jgi:phosphate transport system substrate-binding protein
VKHLRAIAVAGALVAAVVVPAAAMDISGAGATFPYPIYAKWADAYKKETGVGLNYQSIGSGGGISQLSSKVVDFGASDGPMNDDQLKAAGFKILHFPTVLGAAVPSYNIPGVTVELKFTPDALAGIFLGKITKWNDPAIAGPNPGVKLPADDIVVVHRSDGSGTTYIWTDYLSKVSKDWEGTVGKGTSVKWPIGLGGKGNEGVAGSIRQLPGSVGYIELIYALQNKIPFGVVQNSSKNFIKASLASTTAAAAGVKMPADFRVSITNPSGKDAYPIASFTWLLIPTNPADANKGKIIKDFLFWMLDKGQGMVEALSYAPLPAEVVTMEKAAITKQVKP